MNKITQILLCGLIGAMFIGLTACDKLNDKSKNPPIMINLEANTKFVSFTRPDRVNSLITRKMNPNEDAIEYDICVWWAGGRLDNYKIVESKDMTK